MKHPLLCRFIGLSLVFCIAFNLVLFGTTRVQAATGTLSVLSDTMSREQKSLNSSHIIKFTTSLAINVAADTIVVTFPSDFNFTSAAISEVTFTHGASTGAETTEVLAATPDTTKWGAVFSVTPSRILTLTAPTDGTGAVAVATSDKIILTYASTHAVNPSTAGSYTINIAVGGTNTMTGKIGVVILDSEQVGVTATVDPTLTFSIADATMNFGSFVGTAIRYADDATGAASAPGSGNTTKFTAATNGLNGWSISIRDSYDGLYSTVGTELIPATGAAAVTTGSKKYGVYGIRNDAGVTIDANFGISSNYSIATSSQVFASTVAPSGDKNVDMILKAAIDATTKAGNYTDTITVICTGNY